MMTLIRLEPLPEPHRAVLTAIFHCWEPQIIIFQETLANWRVIPAASQSTKGMKVVKYDHSQPAIHRSPRERFFCARVVVEMTSLAAPKKYEGGRRETVKVLRQE